MLDKQNRTETIANTEYLEVKETKVNPDTEYSAIIIIKKT